jgi:zinc protease
MVQAVDVSPASLERRSIRTRLSCGLKIALLPKPTRHNLAHAVLNLRFGDPESLAGRRWVGYLTARMLLHGTQRHTCKQIRDEFTIAGARVSVFGDAQVVTATISASRNKLVRVLALVAECFRFPALRDSDLQELKRSVLLSLDFERTDPEWSAWRAFNRALHPYPWGDIRRTQTAEEEAVAIRAIDGAAIRRFHADYYGASTGELAVIGDFDFSTGPA